MNRLFTYPQPVWEFSNHSYTSITQEVIDDVMITKIKIPGKTKEQIDVKYSADPMSYTIFVDGAEYGQNIHIDRQINSDEVTAKLDLGVLTIKAPILNQDKTIQIE